MQPGVNLNGDPMFPVFAAVILGTLVTDSFNPFPSGVSLTENSDLCLMEWNREEGFLSAESGDPLLPLVARVYILPGNSRITSAEASLSFSEGSGFQGVQVRAAEQVRPVGSRSSCSMEPSLSEITAEEPIVSVHTGSILGRVTIASVSLNPWRYFPDTGELDLAESCTLEFSYESSGETLTLSALQALSINHRLSAIAHEYDIQTPPNLFGQSAETDYLLITGEDFVEAVAPLAGILVSRFYSVEILTVEDIEGSWSGSDVQEDIRNCIRSYALNNGTAYVLLAGDEEVVPAREVYMECEGYVETAPCDLYYADIDGSWDENGNGIFGEWEDSLDMYADVILGRLLFSTAAEAEAIVSKNLEYTSAPEADWYRQAVLCGAQLFPEIGYTAEKGCEIMAEEFPNSFDLTKAYQAANGDYSDTYFPVLYSGAGWNHYAGHGNDRGVYWAGTGEPVMSVSRMYGFSNPGRYGIHSSIGCHTGDFTDPGVNLVDTLITLPDGGGVACLFNTTWGWEGYWPEIGSSERLCLYTIQQVYDQKAPTLGLAYTTAKDLEIPHMTGPYDRVMQSVLAYSAFTEPALEVLGVTSGSPIPPQPYRIVMQGPNPIVQGDLAFKVTGASDSYDVSVYDISGRKVMDTMEVLQNTACHIQVDELFPGVYFLHARSPGGTGISSSFVRIR